MRRLLYLSFFIVGVALVWVGCSKENNDEETNVTDQQALSDMMTGDQDLEGLDTWGGDDSEIPSAVDTAITPLRWHRHGSRHLLSVQVQVQGDTLATITRTFSYNGLVRIVTDSANGYVDKTMYNTLVRKAHAIRVDRSRFPRRNWRITEVTPEVLMSTPPDPNTIWPVDVSIYATTLFEPRLIAHITDPLNTYFPRDSLPSVPAQTQIIVRVTANRGSNALAFLHPRVYPHVYHPRIEMRDDGVFPDAVAGDGIFAALFDSGDRMAIHAVGLDLLDHGTLYDSASPYDAGGWAIPYRVLSPAH